MSELVQGWWASGSMMPASTNSGETFDLFVRDRGEGPAITLLHGYPSSSFDWRTIAEQLESTWRVVSIDLLGFGRSEKPWPHAYNILEQADLVEALWRDLGIESTDLVVHDYSSSIGQELASRAGASRFSTIVFLNGGVYPHLHRPTDGQLLLRGPDGDVFAQAITADLFAASIRATFGTKHPVSDAVIDDMWFTISHDGGQALVGKLLHYIDDRALHAERWIDAMEHAPMPITFIWGPEDPVSGAHMLAEIRRRNPAAAVVELEGVGHWPMLEDPAAVGAAIVTAVETAHGR